METYRAEDTPEREPQAFHVMLVVSVAHGMRGVRVRHVYWRLRLRLHGGVRVLSCLDTFSDLES